MSRRQDPGWRDRAATDLLIGELDRLDSSGRALLMDSPLPDLGIALRDRDVPFTQYHRRALGNLRASSWPAPGPYGLVTLRLPRAKEELSMGLSAAASVLSPGGAVLVYGANDEGIRGAMGTLGETYSSVEALVVGGRCRVLVGTGAKVEAGRRFRLEDWKTLLDLGYPGLPPGWVSYPGVFSHGRLDPGTRLLLDSLPPLPAGGRILDYGCGSGVVGFVVLERGADLALEMLDHDAVALEAARENVPEARFHLRDGLPTENRGSFDAIVSNPPFHRGKAEEPAMIVSLIHRAAPFLAKGGVLVFVAQRRLPLASPLREQFQEVNVLAEDRIFRVWEGRNPKPARRL
ncbi:MAG: class I SAM-dependent methyltransferase [Gemmatimonadetes bacterium]|nr:methyltransferase [Gemmatimonadota bacterium]NNM06178.1 class I SAM-dependent methyltransferase [Gemmatimonadota bacterium]